MKKATTLLIVCLLLFAGTQTTHAQTKEETVAWLKENLEKYIHIEDGWHIQDLEVSPCEISWTEQSDKEYQYGHSSFFCSFNPADGGNWSNKGNTLILAETNVVYSKDYSGINGTYVEHGLGVFFIKENENGIATQIAEKLNYLATFCVKKQP
jgi:hypothetical protein